MEQEAASMGNEQVVQQVLLGFSGADDKLHPHNWHIARRVWTTLILALFNLVVTISSSIFSSAEDKVATEFAVGQEVTVLGTSLFLVVSYTPWLAIGQWLRISWSGIYCRTLTFRSTLREIRAKMAAHCRCLFILCLWPNDSLGSEPGDHPHWPFLRWPLRCRTDCCFGRDHHRLLECSIPWSGSCILHLLGFCWSYFRSHCRRLYR